MRPFVTRRRLLVLSTAVCLLIALAGGVVILARPGPPIAPDPPDLSYLDESMLLDEGAVPAVPGTSWGAMVAVPRGVAPPVSPPGCGLFLSQAQASQKGLAMRSAKGTAIGVELAITEEAHDLDALVGECRSFTFDGGSTRSRVELGPLAVEGLPAHAVGTSCTAGR
ncbi:hypothetical protein BH09ACT7_BH09ACT7_25990 [soil metagenome]